MLKFIKGHASSIDGIEIYPIISLTIFFLFFLGLLVYVYRIHRSHISTMGQLPLDDRTVENDHPVNTQPL
ncbi:MAG TPA: CcoQ/FixQ family Cbb3-type cytochrome c oxidase assembly chaperone [Cytophagales bacterium]|nr:CcoQ/FixQ family Cbb3-type cytochrome c oxidase assembly chaperone [Cytophagales bacterium]HAA19275.1 CcoQ/FixQ family Cbb3-type cytochrome c oxidase assembly chaperone [Cytophagales bacterium]HAP58811.1 CcoQ/FixQ family Cbb3-type cytochrome c oxidase assembly chaperone [Cytophagales bacterium]